MAKPIYIINGPNLNLLGTRQPEIYGYATLQDIESRCREAAKAYGLEVTFLQSNHEGQLVDWIQQAMKEASAIVINAAAYTHTSVAIHDALLAYGGRILELHISNPHARESFRHLSYVSTAADAIVAGVGVQGYELVIPVVAEMLADQAGAVA